MKNCFRCALYRRSATTRSATTSAATCEDDVDNVGSVTHFAFLLSSPRSLARALSRSSSLAPTLKLLVAATGLDRVHSDSRSTRRQLPAASANPPVPLSSQRVLLPFFSSPLSLSGSWSRTLLEQHERIRAGRSRTSRSSLTDLSLSRENKQNGGECGGSAARSRSYQRGSTHAHTYTYTPALARDVLRIWRPRVSRIRIDGPLDVARRSRDDKDDSRAREILSPINLIGD